MTAPKDGNLYISEDRAIVGQAVETFRGESATLVGWSAARRRVYIKMGPPNSQAMRRSETLEYFPSIINAEFR